MVLVRLPPWMTRRNRHPHDLMWPVAMLNARVAAERAGFRATVVDLHVEQLDAAAAIARIRAMAPDVVMIDSMTPTLSVADEMAQKIRDRRPKTQIFAIGQHATARPGDFDRTVFSGVLRGEVDAAIPGWLQGNSMSGLNRVEDADEAFRVDPRGLLLDEYGMRSTHVPMFGRQRWGFLLTSRGCPYRCTFCSPTLRQSYGRAFRGQSAAGIADDMRRLRRDHGLRAFYMIDDVFTFDRDRTLAFAEDLARKPLDARFVIQTRPDLVDRQLLDALKTAGCAAVKMGVESGSDRVLKTIKKGVTAKRIEQAARDIKAAGLGLTAYYMLGHPDETRAEMMQTLALARRVDADMIQVAFHTPYPGSTAWNDQADDVRDPSQLHHYETRHVNVSQVSGAELERLQRAFYMDYYLSPTGLLRYATRRAVYRALDLQEWRLAAASMRYLLLDRTDAASGNRHQPRDRRAEDLAAAA